MIKGRHGGVVQSMEVGAFGSVSLFAADQASESIRSGILHTAFQVLFLMLYLSLYTHPYFRFHSYYKPYGNKHSKYEPLGNISNPGNMWTIFSFSEVIRNMISFYY